MGRFKPEQFIGVPKNPSMQSTTNQGYGQPQQIPADWPTVFPKGVIGLDRDGTIIEDVGEYITEPSQVRPIHSSLEAIRMLRLKGYRVVIITNQAGISKGVQTQAQVDGVHNHLMQLFGQAGIMSIDGLYYSTSNAKEDYYAKPNIGMFDRAASEMGVNWKQGWYVGDKITDLKAAVKAGSKPILVRTGHGKASEEELEKFSRKDLKKATTVFDNLYEFAKTLP